MKLLSDARKLARSSIVANSKMNRQRVLSGVNSYQRELRFDIIDFLLSRLRDSEKVVWLDLCCGQGNALIDASLMLQDRGVDNIQLMGIDLFVGAQISSIPFLDIRSGILPDALPSFSCDLVTCVHGLHYIGDKLLVITKACEILKPDGVFISNLDHKNIKATSGKTLPGIRKWLSHAPVNYSPTTHIVRCTGNTQLKFSWLFTGANDQAGPNYTLQSVVDSYYQVLK